MKQRLDLHGKTKDEAYLLIDRFLLQASQFNLKQVSIMTGIGTGIIKAFTIDYLKKAKYPWQFEKMPNGKINEGVITVFVG